MNCFQKGKKETVNHKAASATHRAFLNTNSENAEYLVKSNVPLVFIPGIKSSHLSYYISDCDEKGGGGGKRGTKKKGRFDFLSSDSASIFCGTSTSVNRVNRVNNSVKSTSTTSNGNGNNGNSYIDIDNSSSMIDNENNNDSNVHIKSNHKKAQRVWATLSGLMNFPPLSDDDPTRTLALPLTYTNGIQDNDDLIADGVIEYVLDVGPIQLFPSYGHICTHLKQLNDEYNNNIFCQTNNNPHVHARPTAIFSYDWRKSIPELSKQFQQFCEQQFPNQPVQIIAHSYGGLVAFDAIRSNPRKYQPGGVFVGVPFQPGSQYIQDLHRGNYTRTKRCRQLGPPTMFTFASHWVFFPMDKETLGDRFVDVTEEEEDDIINNTNYNRNVIQFEENKTTQGQKIPKADGKTTFFKLDAVKGKQVDIDFYNVNDWERLELGIFNPRYDDQLTEEKRTEYKEHMKIQLQNAKSWRQNVLMKEVDGNKDDFPNLVMCGSNAFPTVNQVLRRRRRRQKGRRKNEGKASSFMSPFLSSSSSFSSSTRQCTWEYDYASGRSVPGDGRIDYIGTYPYLDLNMKKVVIDSRHFKQMCWEDSGKFLEVVLYLVIAHYYCSVVHHLLSHENIAFCRWKFGNNSE